MSCQLPRIAIAAALIAISACTVEPADREPPPVDVVYNGATCGNGAFDATELCVENPGKTVIDTGEQVVTVLSRDVDGDGINDVVAVSRQRIWVRKGIPGGFGAQISFAFAGSNFTDIAIGDFDGDGLPDLAASDNASTGSRVAVLHNNGGLVFAAWTLINVAANPVRILAGRINSDIRSDLVVLSFGTGQAQVLLANGVPFAGPVAYMVGDAEDIALADCNLDGRADLLYANGFGNPARLRARTADMFGNLSAPIASVMPLFDNNVGPLDAFAIVAGDFDGDADPDAVVSASFARLAPMVNVGGCNFVQAFNANTMPFTWAWTRARLRTVSWNADAHLDVAAPHGDPASAGEQTYSIVTGTGVGTFVPYLAEPHPPGTVVPKDLAFTDVNGDGRLDVLVAAATGVVLETRIQ